ncbi:hypothetical protein V1951_21255 [Yersinia sp. 2544 StPb PI]|uniref:hypothetical protein n=1 Tax=unclassified Yersinia (in: enterobacteria) TaxID=2653513 RepID=UPI000E65DEEE|nr:hypothetical protein D3Z09_09375 [Rahnella aquatilis]
MKAKKTTPAKRSGDALSPHRRAQNILKQEDLQSEYVKALEFAVWFNTRRYRATGKILTESVLDTVNKATKDYIIAGQARRVRPQELKRKILASAHKNINQVKWVPDAKLEEEFSFMAGAPSKARAKA